MTCLRYRDASAGIEAYPRGGQECSVVGRSGR